MKPCEYCNSIIEKTSELPLSTLLLCQITKYPHLSELVDIENKSHCIEEFNKRLQYTKEPFDGTKRGPFAMISNLFKGK